MGYSALLFCPDEKTARVVTQVLGELEFAVETCNEPFAAVKKMMAQHFDAIVVDCENEQNATLLFKSARNSGSNQNSLAVAVVEGQAGVARAFRIGANLVLTKPINVEQSKGTLRVARGLLRKADAPRLVAAQPPASVESQPATPAAEKPVTQSLPATPVVRTSLDPATAAPSRVEMAQPAASAAAFELEADPSPAPEPTEAALLESMPDLAQRIKKPGTGFTEASWQPAAKPADSVAEAKAKPALDFASSPSSAAKTQPFAAGAIGKGSAGAAVAPAKEPASTVAPAKPAEPSAIEFQTAAGATLPEPPTFGATAKAAARSGSQKLLVVAAIVILAAAAGGYFAWGRLRHAATAASNFSQPATASHQAPAVDIPQPAISDQPPSAEVIATPLPPVTQPAASAVTDKTPASKPSTPAASTAAEKPQAGMIQQTSVPPLMVKAEVPKATTQPTTPQGGVPDEPPAVTLGTGSAESAISGIVSSTPTHVPRASDAIKVSQGVAQGLLVTKVPPSYPAQALQARIQGAVVLQANITKDGSITGIKLLSGDSLLARAAVAAVKQWKYKPYFLDGNPVEIQTQITVNFKLP